VDCREHCRNRFGFDLGEKTMKKRLANVSEKQGRVDVALYRMADRVMERLERDQGLLGLRENILPIVEDFILRNVPARNLIPQEIAAVLKICQLNQAHMNQGKGGGDGHQ
jgi:hypothetical protein